MIPERNQWLRTHHGYVYLGGDWCNLNLTAPNDLEPSGNIRFISEAPKPSLDTLHSYIDHSNPIAILHVRNKTHFVLATGYVPGTQQIVVNDPFFPVDTYDYGQVADTILYHVAENPSAPAVPPKPSAVEHMDHVIRRDKRRP